MTLAELLAQLAARLAANPRELAKVAPTVCHSPITREATVLDMRSGGKALTAEMRDELLRKCEANEYVELELDVLAYEQKTGSRNRNSVRFRDGGMMALGRTGVGTPFLKNHAQRDVQMRGGTMTSSSTSKRADGDYAIQQTVKLTAPWAVDLALRGLLDAVSIGWDPTGPVLCSACDAPIFTVCYHFPGDTLSEKDNGKAGKKLTYDPNGAIVVEWVFTEAELVETSAVNIGGVPTARITDVRASMAAHLSASNPALASVLDAEGNFLRGDFLPEERTKMDPELLKLLGLTASATAEEVLAAVQKLNARTANSTADAAELGVLRTEVAGFKKQLDSLSASQRVTDEDKFIAEAMGTGRLSKASETEWRALFQAAPDRARTLMTAREPNSVTPVGAKPQSAAPEPKLAPAPRVELVREHRGPMTYSERMAKKQLAAAEARLMAAPGDMAKRAALLFGYIDESGALGELSQLGATSITNDAVFDATKVGFHAAFMQALYQKKDEPVSLLYTEVPSSKKTEQYNWMGDLPGFEEWLRDRKMSGLDAYKWAIDNKKWSSGLRIKNDDFADDALGLLGPQVAGMAAAAKRHRWDLMIQLLLNGFNGTNFPATGNGLSYDAAFFFSHAHLGGNDNLLTLALDAAGLQAAELLFGKMVSYDGVTPLDINGTHLIVGPANRTAAEKLMKQERLANGEDNINRGKYELIVSNRIRGAFANYWFLADLSSPIKPFLLQMREEITTSAILGTGGGPGNGGGSGEDSIPGFTADESWYGAKARYNAGYFEPRMIVGSAN